MMLNMVQELFFKNVGDNLILNEINIDVNLAKNK